MTHKMLVAVLAFVCICTGFAGVAVGATLPNVTCPNNLNSCTANDVVTTVLAVDILKVCYHNGIATNTTCTTNANCAAGDTCAADVCESLTDNIFIQITNSFGSTASQRYDLGLYVSGDGGTVQEPSSALVCSGAAAQTGDGNLNFFPDADTDLFLNLDPSGHSSTPSTPDTCGDLDATFGPVSWTVAASVQCNIQGGNLVIPSCRVWEQNANHKSSCQTLAQAGTGSKCDCTPLVVTPPINPCATMICNDNNICTLDSCQVVNGQGQCVYTPGNDGTVCREAVDVCDTQDTCSGGTCADLKKPTTTVCRASSGQCDVAESCDGQHNSCPSDGFASATTTCTGTSNSGACDGTDSCDGSGHCVDGFKSATTVCRVSAGQCDVAESCTGNSSACPADGFASATTTCTGTSTGGACDGTDSCDGAGHCQDGFKSATTTCRASAGQCDVAESCTGNSGACPADGFASATTTCTGTSNGGACDGTDSCDGSGHCTDGYKPATTICRAKAGQCDVAESCTGSSGECPPDVFSDPTVICVGQSNGGPCDLDESDTCDGQGGCVDQFKPATTICRTSAGECDVAESCTGNSGSCPADGFQSATTSCTGTSNGGACDATDSCDGSGHCVDGFKPATTTCRAATGECDVAESCTGNSGACPADAFVPVTTTCTGTSNGGACDATDSCDGAGHCIDGFKPATTTCRSATGECDLAESCTGTSGECPADAFVSATTTCTGTSNGGACDATDSCDGSGHCVDGFKPATTTCRASTGECDLAESCTGSSGECPADAFVSATTTCTGTSNGGACDATDSCDGSGRFYDRRNSRANIEKKGIGILDRYSWYHTLLGISRTKFLLFIFTNYILVNLVFACIYYMIGIEHLTGIGKGSGWKNFSEVFFFSTQTFTTVGYGRIAPTSFLTSAVSTFEAFLGLLSFAIATGLFYGRFSRPRAFLRFSENALIAPYKDGTALMFRMASYKNNNLSEAEVKVTMAMQVEENGKMSNKFYTLDLEISRVNALALSWTVVHPISEKSPFYGFSEDDIKNTTLEILVFVQAFDEVFSNTVVQRTSYISQEIVWGAKFKLMYHPSENKKTTILNLSKLNAFDRVELPLPVTISDVIPEQVG